MSAGPAKKSGRTIHVVTVLTPRPESGIEQDRVKIAEPATLAQLPEAANEPQAQPGFSD